MANPQLIHILHKVNKFLSIPDQINLMQLSSLTYNSAPQWLRGCINLNQALSNNVYNWLKRYKNVRIDVRLSKDELHVLNTLPSNIIHQIQTLDLSCNQLTSLPESFGQLQSLQTLYLHCNYLTSLPESIGQLQNLQKLYLQNNRLTCLSESIGQLKSLRVLDLSWNLLICLPESIGQLQSLQILYLQANRLTSLPKSIDQLPNLQDPKL